MHSNIEVISDQDLAQANGGMIPRIIGVIVLSMICAQPLR